MSIRTRIKTSITTKPIIGIQPFKKRIVLPTGKKIRAPRDPKAPANSGGARRHFAGARGNSAIRNTVPGQQRCSVRASYTSNGSAGHWRQHGVYLEREGAQKEGQKGAGFNEGGSGLSIAPVLNSWQNAGDERMFKLIISPEFGSRVDLQEFTRDFVKKLEKDLDTKLQWVAVDHYNTEYPHVHVALRGVDQDGQPLAMHPGYIKEGLRQRAQEGMTDRIGYRTTQDDLIARKREVSLYRFTGLDKEILRRSGESLELVITAPINSLAMQRNKLLRDRLAKLEEMGFAEQIGAYRNQWRIHPSLEEALRRLAKAKDKQKALAKHQEFILDKHAPLVNTTLKPGGWLVGRVLGSGLDEASDKLYAMLEGADGKVHYVLHDYKLEESEPVLIPGKIAVLAFSAEGDTKALNITQHHEMPVTALDKLIRGRFFRNKELEQPAGELDTFANRTRRQMLERFDQLTRDGTIAKWQAKKEQAKTKATSKAFVVDGMDEGLVVSAPEEGNLRKKAGTRGA